MVRGFAAKREVMVRYPGTREVYLPGGKPFAEGDIFRQPDLAHTLELLAEKGFDGFYRGETANRSEEHTSELQSLMRISYAVFCLKKKKTQQQKKTSIQYQEH